MPTVSAAEKQFDCAAGANLRRVLLAAGFPLYNGPMKVANCRGLGTCGTCAVRVTGGVAPPTRLERIRLAAPPHNGALKRGLRLACQCRVEGDVQVEKPTGWWGQNA